MVTNPLAFDKIQIVQLQKDRNEILRIVSSNTRKLVDKLNFSHVPPFVHYQGINIYVEIMNFLTFCDTWYFLTQLLVECNEKNKNKLKKEKSFDL